MKLPAPFAYPTKPHVRRHGPEGYSEYRHYRNWLRDEFSFRCVYCLCRETWFKLPRDHEIDHFLPKSDRPDVERDYDNLVFACRQCNGTKAAKYLPAPESVAYGECLSVDDAGQIHAKNRQGEKIIKALRLDAADYTGLRRDILAMVEENKSSIGSVGLKRLLGYPDNLPNLSHERKPSANKRANGIQASCYVRRHISCDLPDYY